MLIPKIVIEINNKVQFANTFDIKNCVAQMLETTLEVLHWNLNAKRIIISVLITNDEEMQNLKEAFLNIKEPTDVLSFPAYEDCSQIVNVKSELFLGDIALGYEFIKNQSLLLNTEFEHHLRHMVVHSILHLLGYDHIKDEDAIIMEKLECEILARYNISNPYVIPNLG